MKKIILEIEGMHCEGCSSRLTRVLNALDGVKETKVSLEEKKANIEYDENIVNIEEIKQSIEDTGFQTMED